MFRVVLVGTTGRRGIELQCRAINLLQADLRRVVPHHRALASKLEELLPVFLAGAKPRFISELAEEVSLFLGCDFAKRFGVQCLGAGIKPDQSVTEAILNAGIAPHHEVYEFSHSGLFGPWRVIARNDHFCEALYRRAFCLAEKLGRIGARACHPRPGALMAASKGPAAESRKAAGRCGERHHPQHPLAQTMIPAAIRPCTTRHSVPMTRDQRRSVYRSARTPLARNNRSLQ